MDNWTKTTDGLPKKPGKKRYEGQIPCLVVRYGQIEILVWNCEDIDWYDRFGDEYECQPLAVSHWIPLPEMPSDLSPINQ